MGQREPPGTQAAEGLGVRVLRPSPGMVFREKKRAPKFPLIASTHVRQWFAGKTEAIDANAPLVPFKLHSQRHLCLGSCPHSEAWAFGRSLSPGNPPGGRTPHSRLCCTSVIVVAHLRTLTLASHSLKRSKYADGSGDEGGARKSIALNNDFTKSDFQYFDAQP